LPHRRQINLSLFFVLTPEQASVIRKFMSTQQTETRGRGRPALPAAEVRKPVAFRMSEQEMGQLANLAALLGCDKSDALRHAIVPPLQVPTAASTPALTEASILAAIRTADLRGNHRGLVPIGEVRGVALKATGCDRETFDRLLLDMERRYVVDLKCLNDP